MAREPDSAGDGANALAGLLPVLLHGTWRYRLLIVLAVGVGTAGGVFRGVVTPNQYQSIGKLIVKDVRETSSLETEFSRVGGASRVSGIREAVQNEMQVLGSSVLFDKVVARVGADNVLAPYDPASVNTDGVPWHTSLFHAFQSWWFSSAAGLPSTDYPVDAAKLASLVLQRSIVIVPEQGTSVITFLYASHSPERARVVVDQALQAAIDLHGEVFMTMASLAKVEAELKIAEDRANEAERVLREFRLGKEIYDFDALRTNEVAKLNDITRRLEAAQAEVARKTAELEQLKVWRNQVPEKKHLAGSRVPIVNPVWQKLTERQEVLRLDLQRLELEKEIKPESHREQKPTIDKMLQSIHDQLQQEKSQVVLEGIPDENPDYLQVSQRIEEVHVDLKGLEADIATYGKEKEASTKKLAALEAVSPELRRLEIDAQQKRSTADTLLKAVTTQKAVQRFDQLNLSNIGVLHPASLEVNKVGPARGKMVFYGMFGGAFFGIAIAALLTLVDRRIRIRADLVRLGVPDEGVVCGHSNPIVVNTNGVLPQSLAGIREDVARFWTAIPYDRRDVGGLRIAFVPCGDGANVGRAAASLAIGLAAHGGEKVLYVATVEGSTWLAQRLGINSSVGWSEVVRGERTLEATIVTTPIAGLCYLPAGTTGNALPHPMAGPAFVAMLDRLATMYRFVILELPDPEKMPEGRSVLGVADAAELVVCRETSTKSSVRTAMAMVKTAGARLLGGFLQARKGGETARVPTPTPTSTAPGS